jgi:hypothetical protein
MSYKTYFETPEVRVCCTCQSLLLCHAVLTCEFADMSQHSHEIGLANLAYTRRGRRAQAAAKSAVAGPDSSMPPASPSRSGGPCLQPNQTTGQMVAPMRAQSELTPSYSSPYPHFPSMSMPLPQGLGTVIPLAASSAPALAPTPPAPIPFPVPPPNQGVAANDRDRMERERWDRMDVLYQSIRSNARQFEYPAASVAALESVLVRMYFESPIPAPQPQPPLSFGTATLPLAQVPTHQPEHITVGNGGQSDGTSESDGDDEDEE